MPPYHHVQLVCSELTLSASRSSGSSSSSAPMAFSVARRLRPEVRCCVDLVDLEGLAGP